MVTGATGINGQRAVRPVGRGHRSGFAHVMIPNHCMGESSVKVRHKKSEFVIQENAQVCFLKCSNGLSLYIRLTTTTTFIDPLYLKKIKFT